MSYLKKNTKHQLVDGMKNGRKVYINDSGEETMFSIRCHQTFPVKGQRVNVLGFVV